MIPPLDSPRPRCSVVIPSFNGRDLLAVCLASIRRHWPAGIGLEVIVADDASTDNSVGWLDREFPEVRVVALPENGGFCRAANAGIAAARGDFVQLLNNDTEVEAGWVEAGLAPFADPTVGSVAPLVIVRSDPDRVDSAGDQYTLVGWPSKRGHGEATSRWANHPSDRVFGASGSSAFYRASALRAVGGFDLSFGSYYEDVDLAFRLRWAGYECVFQPQSRIRHEVSATYDHTNPRLQERMSCNGEVLFWSNLPLGLLLLAVGPHAAFTLLQASYRLLRGRLRPFARGKLAAARSWRRVGTNRRVRADLARAAVRPPRFRIRWSPLGDLLRHWRRPMSR